MHVGRPRQAMNHLLRAIVVLALPLVFGAGCLDDENGTDDSFPWTSGHFTGGSVSGVAPDGGGGPEAAQAGQGGVTAIPCVPICAGMDCGSDDGSGGLCTLGCNCWPTCGPLDCWTSDGCGGLCTGGCCTPLCYASDCGASDGCGGSCDDGCDDCSPSCGPFDCGADDGCGGSCEDGC